MPSASCEPSLTRASFLKELLPALDPFHSHGWDFCRSWGQLQTLVMLTTDVQGNSRDGRQLPRKWKHCSNALIASDTTGHFWHWQLCWRLGWDYQTGSRGNSVLSKVIIWTKGGGREQPLKSWQTDINCVCPILCMLFLSIVNPWGSYCYTHYICRELQSS